VTSPRNYLLVFLALTTLGGVVLAWNQHLELIKLRAALQGKDLDAQLHQREFETKLAAAQASASKKTTVGSDDAASQDSADDQWPHGRFGNNMQARMNNPEFVRLLALQQKAALNNSYAPLFKQLAQKLALSPAQIDAFQNLLVEKQSAARDAIMAARDQGLDPRTDRAEISQLVAQSNAQIDSQIQSTLGPDGFTQYQNYEQTLPERNTVNLLQQMMSYTNTPISDQEVQPLIDLLASNAPKNAGNPTSPRALFGGPNRTATIPDGEVPSIAGLIGVPPSTLQPLLPTINAQNKIGPLLRSGAAAGAAPTAGTQSAGH
jgi:hypothetical protein